MEVDRLEYKISRNRLSQVIRHAKSVHVQSLLKDAEGDARKMFSVVDGLLGKKASSTVLPELNSKQAADALSMFFIEKIETIRKGFGEMEKIHLLWTHPLQALLCRIFCQ